MSTLGSGLSPSLDLVSLQYLDWLSHGEGGHCFRLPGSHLISTSVGRVGGGVSNNMFKNPILNDAFTIVKLSSSEK